MKTLFVATCALALTACGPPPRTGPGCAVAETEQELEGETVTMEELPVLKALIDEVAKGQLVLEQVPVEERFFHVVTVTQTPPQTPLPPCPTCR